jgi:hypothetical protein
MVAVTVSPASIEGRRAPFDEGAAIERMLDDGAPTPPEPGLRVSSPKGRTFVEPSAQERIAQRRAVRNVFWLHCVACSRTTEPVTAPPRPQRCAHCGGTMIAQLVTD